MVAINSRLITSFSTGRGVLEEECAKTNTSGAIDSLRLRVMTKSPLDPISTPKKDASYFVDKYWKLALVAYHKRQYNLCVKYTKRACEIGGSSKQSGPPTASPPGLALQSVFSDCQELQADCEVALGRDVKAVELYRSAVTIRSALHSDDKHVSVAKCVSSLCHIYRRHKAFSLALHYALYLQDICLHNAMGISIEMAMALSHVASVKQAQGLRGEAQETEKRALEMRISLLGSYHPAVARSLHR